MRRQSYEGTDRQVRGRQLALLREACAPEPAANLLATSEDPVQAERALASLIADGLVVCLDAGRYALPGAHPPSP